MSFENDRHVLYVGWVFSEASKDTDVEPVLDEAGNYTNRLTFHFHSTSFPVTLIVPPPPDEWALSYDAS